MKTPSSRNFRRPGFTLVELLVVIVMIVGLAALVFAITRKAMAGAYQSRNASQMRDIGTAVAMWAAEHNNNEPMYFANGTGDYAEEGAATGKNPLLSPGNPAKLLYKKDDLGGSYIQDYTVFFTPSPNSKIRGSRNTILKWPVRASPGAPLFGCIRAPTSLPPAS